MKNWLIGLVTGCLCLWTVGYCIPSAAAAGGTTTIETRAQFLQSLCQTLDVQPATTAPQVFSDVPPGAAGYGCIMAAYQKGWISGFPGGAFQPDGSLTREQVAKIEVLALGLQSQAMAVANQEPTFYDSGSIGKWAWGYVNALVNLNILQGFTTRDFKPTDTFTVDQTSYAITQLQDYWSHTNQTSNQGRTPRLTLAPTLSSAPAAAASTTTVGATQIAATPNTAGDQFAVQVSTGSLPTPVLYGSAPTGSGVTNPYSPGADLNAAPGNYVGVYELNASGDVVAFSELTLTSAQVASPAPALGSTPTAAASTTIGATYITATPNTAGDSFAVQVSTDSLMTPALNSSAPAGSGVTNPYSPGADLNAAPGNYVGVYELNASGEVVAFSELTLTPVEVGSLPPAVTSAATSTDGTQVILQCNTDMADASPYAGEFTVTDNGHAISVGSVDTNGSEIDLWLGNLVQYGDDVTLSYTGSDVQSLGGVALPTFSDVPVTNELPSIPPTLGQAETTTDGYSVILEYNLNIADPSAYASEFSVSDNGVSVGIQQVRSDYSMVIVTLASPVQASDNVTVSYSGSDVETLLGVAVPTFSAVPVINNVP